MGITILSGSQFYNIKPSQEDIELFRKLMARMGIPTTSVCWISLMGIKENSLHEDFFKVFYLCPECGEYRTDHVIDCFSKNEHIECRNCGHTFQVRRLFGISRFFLRECWKAAKRASRKSRTMKGTLQKARFCWYVLTNLDGHLPKTRGGAKGAVLERRVIFKENID